MFLIYLFIFTIKGILSQFLQHNTLAKLKIQVLTQYSNNQCSFFFVSLCSFLSVMLYIGLHIYMEHFVVKQ
jgi:hypothetical protein